MVISVGVLVSSHLSLSSVCERPILFTTPIPPETLPNIVCLPATNENSAINSGQWWKMFQNIVFTILTIKPASWSKCYEKLTSVGIGTTVYCNVGNVIVFAIVLYELVGNACVCMCVCVCVCVRVCVCVCVCVCVREV